MAGPFDFLNSDDPMLGLSLLAAAGPSAVPQSPFQRIYGGLLGFQQQKQAQEDRAFNKRYREAQMGEIDAQRQERLAKVAKDQAALDVARRQQEGVAEIFERARGRPGTGQVSEGLGEFSIGALPPTAGRAPAPGDFARLGITDPAKIKAFMELNDFGRPKVARTIKGVRNGREYEFQLDDQGKPIGEAFEQYRAPISINQGDRTTFADPYSLNPLGNFVTNQSPDSKASTALGWANNRVAQGQLGVARDRLDFEKSDPKMRFDPDRGVMVNERTGEAKPAMLNGQPLGPKDKDMTDSQSKALLFGSRMEASDKIIGDLARRGVDKSVPGSNSGWGVGAAINMVQPAEYQRLDQAKRDFLNAVLRRESGAVIAKEEFDNGNKQYFPQIGDSADVIQQKAQNRALAMRSILAEVPDRKRPTSAGTPMVGQIMDGYKFRGGNPADQANWVKQ